MCKARKANGDDYFFLAVNKASVICSKTGIPTISQFYFKFFNMQISSFIYNSVGSKDLDSATGGPAGHDWKLKELVHKASI